VQQKAPTMTSAVFYVAGCRTEARRSKLDFPQFRQPFSGNYKPEISELIHLFSVIMALCGLDTLEIISNFNPNSMNRTPAIVTGPSPATGNSCGSGKSSL
jgi:hypothetical protein